MSLSTVSATIQDPSGQAFSNGTWQLVFKPTPNTPGLFTDVGVPFTTIFGGSLDGTGSFSQAVARNDTIAPAGSRWTLIVTPNANGQAFSVDLNVNSGAFNASAAINTVVTNIVVAATILSHAYKDSEVLVPPASGAQYYDVVNKVLKVWDLSTSTWTSVLSNLSGVAFNPTGNQTINQPVGTNIFVNRFENIRFADQFSSIMAAYADLPATGGCVLVPPNYSEVVSASWILNKSYSSIVFLGPANLNFGVNTITIPVGIHGVYIGSWIPWGSFVVTTPSGVQLTYTGNGTFVSIGDSTADTLGPCLSNLCYFLNNAGTAAVAIKATRCPIGLIERPNIIGPGGAVTQQGIILDGTGNFTGIEIKQPRIVGMFKGIQLTGVGVNAANACQIYGGVVTSPATGASIGIDFQAGSAGNLINGTDVESHSIGYNFGGTSQANVIFGRSEANTNGAILGASTLQNEVHLINSIDPITDSGSSNLTYTLGGTTHGITLTQPSNLNAVTLLNSQDVVGPLTGNAADQNLYSYTLLGKTLAAGKGVRVRVRWIHGTGTANITYKIFFGASAVVNSTSAVTGNGYAEADIMNIPASVTAQRASTQFTTTGTPTVLTAGLAPAENTVNNVVLKFTFNAANTEQVTGAQWIVELIQ